jgi:hypothetical protein
MSVPAAHLIVSALNFQCFSGYQSFADNAVSVGQNSAVSLPRNLHEIRSRFLVQTLKITQADSFKFFH